MLLVEVLLELWEVVEVPVLLAHQTLAWFFMLVPAYREKTAGPSSVPDTVFVGKPVSGHSFCSTAAPRVVSKSFGASDYSSPHIISTVVSSVYWVLYSIFGYS